MAGKPWYNNGIKEIQVGNNEVVPDGFVRGRLKWSQERRDNWKGEGNPNFGKTGYWTGKQMPPDSRGETLKQQYQSGQRQVWNKGLKGDPRCKGHTPGEPVWNKGLTAETDERVARYVNAWRTGDAQLKSNETKRNNRSFNKSAPEDKMYVDLCKQYGEDNVVRQYSDKDRYPFACDFYIPSEDLFIECNYSWTHGGRPYDENDVDCEDQLNAWKIKAETSLYYQNAIYTWTVLDVKKREYANKYNLNYKVFY